MWCSTISARLMGSWRRCEGGLKGGFELEADKAWSVVPIAILAKVALDCSMFILHLWRRPAQRRQATGGTCLRLFFRMRPIFVLR